MVGSSDHPPLSNLEAAVRDALLHLYDPGYLQTHPLAHLAAGEGGASPALRSKKLLHTLLDAVEALQPPAGTSASSRAWRSYQLLSLRYVEALDVRSVMQRLAISKTQYQREHARALEALTSLLQDQWHLPDALDTPAEEPADDGQRQSLALREAADHLAQMRPEVVDLREVINEILAILKPVTRQRRVTTRLIKGPPVPPVYADRVAARRVFLSLFHRALNVGQGGVLQIGFASRDQQTEVTISAQTGHAAPAPSATEADVAGSFVEALAGTLSVDTDPTTGAWTARVALPVASLPLLLVVDNNQEFVHLVRRYLAGQGWQVEGAGSVEEARLLLRELRPRVILLDVMLPGEDGWDLLLWLRRDPSTRGTTVIVCSVLSEPLVAESLGAVAYLPKPVSQEALLSALAPYL